MVCTSSYESKCVHTCIFMYIHVWTTYIHVYTSKCIYHVYTMYIHVYTCLEMYIHVYTCLEMYKHVCILYMTCTYYSIVRTRHIHGSDWIRHVCTRLCQVGRIPDVPSCLPLSILQYACLQTFMSQGSPGPHRDWHWLGQQAVEATWRRLGITSDGAREREGIFFVLTAV